MSDLMICYFQLSFYGQCVCGIPFNGGNMIAYYSFPNKTRKITKSYIHVASNKSLLASQTLLP